MRNLLFAAVLCCAVLASCTKAEVKTIKTVAHRGHWDVEGSAQNSIASISKAGELGIYGSEFDVNMTSDSVLVINHDFTFHGIRISDNPYEAIKDSTLANGEVIPTLRQYLEEAAKYPDLQLVFELKSDGDSLYEAAAVPLCVEMIKEFGFEDRTDFICFSLTACEAYAALMPGHTVEYLNGDLSPEEINSVGLNGIDYHYNVFQKHPEWVEQAHALGQVVNVWTVNDTAVIKEMIALGVDHITTNDPVLVEQVINETSAE